MKQTTILPFYKPITPKKTPLPLLSKSITKSPYSKSPPGSGYQVSVTVSPHTKRTLIPIEESQELTAAAFKNVNRSMKRKSRDSFEEISQSYQKKFKNNSETLDEGAMKINIKLGPKTQEFAKDSLIHGHEKAFPLMGRQESSNASLETADDSFASHTMPKEQEEIKTSYEYVVSTSSPNSYLEKEINCLPEEVRTSQVMKHLSTRKLALDKENQSPIQEKQGSEKASLTSFNTQTTQKPQISEATLSILSTLKAKNELINRKSQETQKASSKMQVEEPEEELKPSQDTMEMVKLLQAKNPAAQAQQTPIKSLKEQLTQTKSKSSIADILQGPSIREKFAELISSEREFVIPALYKRLLTVFESLDKTMNYFMTRREPTFWSSLTKSVEDMIKIRVTQVQLAQMVSVFPNAYTLSWEKNEKHRGEFDLYLQFPNNENETEINTRRNLTVHQQDERKRFFKDSLIRITKAHHNEFLKTLGDVEKEKNYDEIRCWNSKFKVHECPAIPEGKLPDRPLKESVQSIKEFLLHTESKNTRVMKIMEECLKDNEAKQQTAPAVEVQARQIKNVSGLSEKLLAKVRAKELALAKEAADRKLKLTNEKHFIMNQELKKVAEVLRIYYIQRSVASMFFVNVVEHLVHSNQGLVIGKEEATKYIEELIKLCPAWLTIHEMNNNGNINRILKIDKSINMQIIYENIEKAKTAAVATASC